MVAASKLIRTWFGAGSELLRSWFEAGSKLARSWSPTSFEPDSVMELLALRPRGRVQHCIQHAR